MDITVKKPTEAEKLEMSSNLTWGCDVSVFDWHYEQEETCLMIEGEVTVEYGGKSVYIGEGDMATFPKGLSCIWKVTKPVKKYYIFK